MRSAEAEMTACSRGRCHGETCIYILKTIINHSVPCVIMRGFIFSPGYELEWGFKQKADLVKEERSRGKTQRKKLWREQRTKAENSERRFVAVTDPQQGFASLFCPSLWIATCLSCPERRFLESCSPALLVLWDQTNFLWQDFCWSESGVCD